MSAYDLQYVQDRWGLHREIKPSLIFSNYVSSLYFRRIPFFSYTGKYLHKQQQQQQQQKKNKKKKKKKEEKTKKQNKKKTFVWKRVFILLLYVNLQYLSTVMYI